MLIHISSCGPLAWRCSFQLASVLSAQARHLSVLAWGRNVEGQCGVEGAVPIVARPLPILELHGAAVESIHAGTVNSAAVLHQEVYTWGDGSSGKLGHGSADSVNSPSRVESLVERSGITTAALGHHHSLFLGADGAVWACGENKEGQCGLGLPLEVLASRYRKAYYESIAPAAAAALHGQRQLSNDRFAQYLRAAVSSAASPAPAAAAGQHIAHGWGSLSGVSSRSSRSSVQQQQQQFSQLLDMQRQRGRFAAAAGFDVQGSSSSSSRVSYGLGGGLFGSSSGSSNAGSISSSGVWGADLESLLHGSRLHAGQTGIPARVVSEQSAAALGLRSGPSSSSSSSSSEDQDGLEGLRVVGVSASRFFSLAVTENGEVWAWGADYNGALGSESSWTSSPQPAAAPISQALAAAGGAVAAAAGGTFSAALTAAGTVLVWGKLGGGSPAAPGLTAAAGFRSHPGFSSSSMFAQVQLPQGVRITSISAGQQHLLMTDGRRVWVIGRWLDANSEEAGIASWENPHEFDLVPLHSGIDRSNLGHTLVKDRSTSTCSSGSRKDAGGAEIVKVVAGMHSSAAISNDGRLWLWGRLLDEPRGLSIMKRFGGEKYAADVDWTWAGFGGAEPRLVEGVSGVKDVALGGWHAMVLVD